MALLHWLLGSLSWLRSSEFFSSILWDEKIKPWLIDMYEFLCSDVPMWVYLSILIGLLVFLLT